MDTPPSAALAVCLADIIRRATPADLAALDAEIARLAAARRVLAAVLGHSPAGDPAPGKPLPPSLRQGVTGETPTPGERLSPQAACRERRLSIARLLLERGPLRMSDLKTGLPIPSGSMPGVLKHPWFERSGPSPRDPYRLTEEGRRAASSTPSANAAAPASPAAGSPATSPPSTTPAAGDA